MEPLFSVTGGRPTSAELAALTLVLLSRSAPAGPAGPARPRHRIRWRRLGPVADYRSPVSWR